MIMNSTVERAIAALMPLFALAAGCGGAAAPRPIEHVAIPVADTTKGAKARAIEKEAPPASGPARNFRFPKVVWADLPSGLKVATIPNHALPLVQIRVVVLGGRAADGERPGAAAITGQLLKDGGAGSMTSRDLVTKIESLGATLDVHTDPDSIQLSLGVTRDHMDAALDLLGTIVQRPQFSQVEFEKLKKREIERTENQARTSGEWGASMILYRDLFSLPTDHHPYASFDAAASEIAKLTANDCRALHKKLFVPKNMFVVVSGDTTPEAVKAGAARSFGGAPGGDAPVISFTDPLLPESMRITLVDRPKSSQSDIYVGTLGPEISDKSWPAFKVANQVLGGAFSGRLFLDVREKQSLAYRARSTVVEFGHGPSLLIAYAGTQTAKTGLSVKALLSNLERIGAEVADDDEVTTAKRYLADVFAFRMETVGAVADELVRLRTLGLPDDHDDTYRKEIGEMTAPVVLKAASDNVRSGHLVVVVAGDAQAVGGMLSHFGEVKVVDPTKDFARVRTIPMNAAAPLEVAREAGK